MSKGKKRNLFVHQTIRIPLAGSVRGIAAKKRIIQKKPRGRKKNDAV